MKLKKLLIRITLMVLVLITALLIYGYLVGEQSYSIKTTVNAPLNKTWNTFQNPMHFKKWMGGFKEIEMLDGIPGMPGSVYLVTTENNGREDHLKQKVTISEPPTHFAFDMENDKMTGHIDVQLIEAADGQTIITNFVTYRGTNPLWNAFIAMSKQKISDDYQANFERLKALIEELP